MDRDRIEADIFESKKKARSNLMTRMTIHCERLLTVLVNRDVALAEAEAENARLREAARELQRRREKWAPPGTLPFALAVGLDKLAELASRPGAGAA